jgi:ankyrin repeat protein
MPGMAEILKRPQVTLERQKDYDTPLGYAAREGMVTAIKMLLDAGADVNARSGMMTFPPLAIAAATGQLDCVRTTPTPRFPTGTDGRRRFSRER